MDAPIKVLLIENNVTEVKSYLDYFDTQQDIQLVGATGSAAEGLRLTEHHLPDAIILDLELDEGNGIQFLPQMHGLELPVEPYVVVTTWTSEPRTLQKLRDDGAGHVQVKFKSGYVEHGPEMMTELLREMRPYFRLTEGTGTHPAPYTESPAEKERRAIRNLKEALGRINITSGKKAQNYLATTIHLTRQYLQSHKHLPYFDTEIYPYVEEQYGLKRGSVEKIMRESVEYAWDHTDPETLAREYTQYVSPEKGKPVLRDFIIYYAEKML